MLKNLLMSRDEKKRCWSEQMAHNKAELDAGRIPHQTEWVAEPMSDETYNGYWILAACFTAMLIIGALLPAGPGY